MTEDWKTYRKPPVQEIKKGLPDEIHEFLTKVYNVYFIKLPQSLYKQFDIVRDKLIPLTVRFDEQQYREFCESFSKAIRSVIVDTSISDDVKNLVKELADKTNSFFESKGLPRCIEELKYAKLRVRVLYRGEPLEKAAVVAETGGKTAGNALTDKNGFAELDLPTGKYTVYVYKQLGEDEYVYEEREIELTHDTEIEFKIEESKTYTEIEKTRHAKGPLIREVK
ncbi:MAG: DUF4198 domain-containing protein [Crenarchaeota archaeon]|nr:DUF4198 domain-containing protein [Thermoproteota archaeon]